MMKIFLALLLAGVAVVAKAAIDIPLEARESYLKFRDDSELRVRSDGHILLSAELRFRGATYSLKGKVFAGLEQPDLTTLRLKLVASDQCEPSSNSCLKYSIPLIEILVGGIPEDTECSEECVVRFLLERDRVYRRTSSRRKGQITQYPQQSFSSSQD